MKIRKLSNRILAYTLTLALLLSTLVFGAVTTAAAEDTEVWDGSTATDFAGGDGTSASPYLIETAAQLRHMVLDYSTHEASNGKFFKLTKDIYLNDVMDGTHVKSLANKNNWLDASVINLPATSAANSFSGTLDGNGYTVYGLYVNGAGGLFPAINSYTTVKNLNIENVFIRGGEGNSGALAGIAEYATWQKAANVTNCSVVNATIGQAEDVKYGGGFIGYIESTTINFTNCYATGLNMSVATWVTNNTPGAIVGAGESGGTLRMTNCYTTDYFVTSGGFARTNYTYTNVYTTAALPGNNNDTGVTVLTDDQMKGDAAKTNMTGFDFKYVWKTVENGYPVFSDVKIWDGTWVTSHADFEGSGTADDPYLIENGAQLFYATIKNSNLSDGSYYKLTKDIILNNTSVEGWEATAKPWGMNSAKRFNGTLDGDGHTIEGLYINVNSTAGRYGLFSYVGQDTSVSDKVAEIKNITFKGASVTNTTTSTTYEGVGIVAGQASGEALFENIYIDETSKVNAPNVKGVAGIVARGNQKVTINNCAVHGTYTGGSHVSSFMGTFWGGSQYINNSYSAANVPVTTSRTPYVTNTYATVKTEDNYYDSAVVLLTADQMKGEAAKTYMPGLSFKYIWETVENGYPILNVRGEIWDGSVASSFNEFKGSGTADDPYLIENGAQLAFAMVKNSALNAGTCYKLANDIVLNDTSFDGWQALARSWPHQTANRWVGTLDGDGHTIEGLYMNTATKRPGLVSYSQGTFKNLVFSGASINYTGASEPGVAIIAAQASGATSFENIYIDETCEINSTAVKGVAALAGRGYDSTGNISIINCAVLATINTEGTECGALAGSHWVSGITVKISNCYSTSSKPLFGYATKSLTADSGNNYSIVEDTHGTTVLTLDQMKGEAAKENMSGLGFDFMWETVEDGYPVLRPMDERLSAWSGDIATSLGGEGTKENPYKISNGAELYYAISTYSNQNYATLIETKPYFEITKDINLNNVQWYNVGKTSYPNSTNFATGFAGVIYGNGHTIYNLSNSASVSVAGLIPVATQGAEIYDLHLNGGNLPKVVWNTYVGGGLIGVAVGTNNSTPITIRGCSVENYTIGSRDGSAAFVGDTYSQSLIIKDCYAANNTLSHTSTTTTMNTGAFVGIVDGNGEGNSIIIENCYTDSDADIGYVKEMSTTFKNVYTTDETYANTINGLSLVTADQITGAVAKTTLKGFNFNQFWATVDGAYPTFTDMDYRAGFFSGAPAATFAGGTGIEADPYLISTADQLYLLANLDRETTLGKFYKLTNNISISNVYTGWANDNPYTWAVKKAYLDGFTYTSSFAGTLDGAGYTVSGLYYNNAIVDGGAYAYGLIPFATANAVIKNITVSDVNAVVSGNAYVGAVVGAAHVMAEDLEASSLYAVQFVGVNVTNATIGATTKGDILGGASRGVKFELSNATTLYGSIGSDYVAVNCNNSSAYRKDVVTVNSNNVSVDTLAAVRKVLIGADKTTYITTIDMAAAFDICDLVATQNGLDAAAPAEKLVWSQEFTGSALDNSVWSTNTTMGVGTTLEYANTATFDGSAMTLNCYDTGRVDANGNTIYSVNSGLSTKDTMSFKYGRLEMRAKVPFGAGAFPSLWLTSRNALGNGVSTYGYDNEVDIFEVFGNKTGVDTMVTCIHKWYVDETGARTGDECSCGSGILAGNGYKVEQADRDYQITGAAQDEFHTIVFEWTEDTMTFSVDGNLYYAAKRSDMDSFDISGYDTDSDGIFNQFMYLRLNNHMYTVGDGAAYSYQGNASEINPEDLTYEIDYIRLYQTSDGEINLK